MVSKFSREASWPDLEIWSPIAEGLLFIFWPAFSEQQDYGIRVTLAVFLLFYGFARFCPFLVPFVTTPFNGCSHPILRADDGPSNWSETFCLANQIMA